MLTLLQQPGINVCIADVGIGLIFTIQTSGEYMQQKLLVEFRQRPHESAKQAGTYLNGVDRYDLASYSRTLSIKLVGGSLPHPAALQATSSLSILVQLVCGRKWP